MSRMRRFPKVPFACTSQTYLVRFIRMASSLPCSLVAAKPAEAPGRLALATVLQYVEGLSDRQAADAVRGRIDWKYALGLSLIDPGLTIQS